MSPTSSNSFYYIFYRSVRNAVGPILFIGVAAITAFRLTRGIDLGDEAYYSIFIDDWLKGGIATSTFVTLHQTAALIVYPVAFIYTLVFQTTDGLFLLLRFIFLIGSVFASALTVLFLKRAGFQQQSWLGGTLAISFIPFGLPAPSYNTLGQQALVIALVAFGLARCQRSISCRRTHWMFLSGLAWTIASIAYSSLAAPLAVLILVQLIIDRKLTAFTGKYILVCAGTAVAGWSIVIYSLSWNRLVESVSFLSSTNDVFGWHRKISFASDTLLARPGFICLCCAAATVGFLRVQYPRFSVIAAGVILALIFAVPPTLFARSHDVITLLTLMGLGSLFELRRHSELKIQVLSQLYVASLAAAFFTCATAYNSIYNFCIGALPAAVLALVRLSSGIKDGSFALFPGIVAIGGVLSTSIFFYYGEPPEQTSLPKNRIYGGFFSGIALSPEHMALLRVMSEKVAPLLERDDKVVILGRMPGLILIINNRFETPIPFTIPSSNANGFAALQSFYQKRSHRPDVVILFKDPYSKIDNPIPAFSQHYSLMIELRLPPATLEIFRKSQSEVQALTN